MLSETLVRQPRIAGLQPLLRRGTRGAEELSIARLRVAPGRTEEFIAPEEETVVVVQEGRGGFAANGHEWSVSRANVFAERATALYLPPNSTLRVTAAAPLEAILVSASASAGGDAAVVGPDDVCVNARGRGSYAREVHDIFVTHPHARPLMGGETFNPPGHWGSYPPHQHDGRAREPKLDEIYSHRIHPPAGVR